jgi:uncharacterized membrane protein
VVELEPAVPTRARAGALTSFAFALVGLGVSIYLTIEHFNSSVTLACPESAAVNCVKVTSSRWSHIGPVPVALLGLVFFAAMSVACSPPAWRIHRLDAARIASAVVGVVSVLYFLWAELFKIDAICLWCTVVHVCAVGLLASVLWQIVSRADPPLAR